MFKTKTMSTVYGIDSMIVGKIETRATNEIGSSNSRHAHGPRTAAISAWALSMKNSPSAFIGFAMVVPFIGLAQPNRRPYDPNPVFHSRNAINPLAINRLRGNGCFLGCFYAPTSMSACADRPRKEFTVKGYGRGRVAIKTKKCGQRRTSTLVGVRAVRGDRGTR